MDVERDYGTPSSVEPAGPATEPAEETEGTPSEISSADSADAEDAAQGLDADAEERGGPVGTGTADIE